MRNGRTPERLEFVEIGARFTQSGSESSVDAAIRFDKSTQINSRRNLLDLRAINVQEGSMIIRKHGKKYSFEVIERESVRCGGMFKERKELLEGRSAACKEDRVISILQVIQAPGLLKQREIKTLNKGGLVYISHNAMQD